jgi:hypothetical protein
MKKILILNLANDTEILTSAYFVNNIKHFVDKSAITMLVYEDHLELAKQIPNINIVSINRNLIMRYHSSPFVNDSVTVNTFMADLQPVLTQKWDQVINYSNDNVSAYLSNTLNCTLFTGAIITENGTVRTSNSASAYFNYAYPLTKGEIQFNDIKANYLNIRCVDDLKGKCAWKYESTLAQHAKKNILNISNKITDGKNNLPFIGLVISSDVKFSPDDYLQVLRGIIESNSAYPILISTAGNNSKSTINYLNSYFNNELISVNSTLENFSALAVNLNLIVTTEVNYAIVSDLTSTPNILVTTNINNKSLTYYEHSFTMEYSANFATKDLALLISQLNSGNLNQTIELKSKTFINSIDKYGVTRTPVSNNYIQGCFNFNFTRNYYLNIFTRTNTEPTIISSDYLEKIKTEVSTVTRFMLTALRSLKTAQATNNAEAFLRNIESLMRVASELEILSVPVKLFESKIENLTETDNNKVYAAIEGFLFSLKENIKLCTHLTSASIANSAVNKAVTTNKNMDV